MRSGKRWGVTPSIKSTVRRSRLLKLMQQVGSTCVVLAAPGGYGKTVAAAQYAEEAKCPVVWIGVHGSILTAEEFLARLATLVAVDSAHGSLNGSEVAAQVPQMLAGATVVLDDCQMVNRKGACGVGGLLDLLGPTVDKLIVTTRQTPDASCMDLRDVAVLGVSELALSTIETEQLIDLMDLDDSPTRGAESLRMALAGHPSLTRLALLTSLDDGLEPLNTSSEAARWSIERLIESGLSSEEQSVLEGACLMQHGLLADLEVVYGMDARRLIDGVSEKLPLLRISADPVSRAAEFSVHELVSETVLKRVAARGVVPANLDALVGRLADRARWSRAAEVLVAVGGNDSRLSFIDDYGQRVVDAEGAAEILDVIHAIPLSLLMSRSRAFLCWSLALHQLGDPGEAAAKAAATIRLARHDGDHETLALAVSQMASALHDQGRVDDALGLLESLMPDTLGRLTDELKCEILVAYGNTLGMAERLDEARAALDEAALLVVGQPGSRQAMALQRARAYSHAAWAADYAEGVKALAPLLASSGGDSLSTTYLQGNMAWELAEMGRLDRSRAMLDDMDLASPMLSVAYGPVKALIAAGQGDMHTSLSILDELDEAAREPSERVDRLVHLLYRSAVRRAVGMHEESLVDAETSLEGFLHSDHGGFSRLALVEVAASLISLGDVAAAADWLDSGEVGWQTVNKMHALCRAAMLSVIAAKQGDMLTAVANLAPARDYLQSGGPNWRMAMYVSAFPELLGLIASSLGADRVPTHMMQCVRSVVLERALLLARDMLPDSEWRVLGERALGEEQFLDFVERKGRPICRVRLFGGLDVSVDGRPVSEKDWKKRKARLLFAMLVVRRGQDIPRDVILDHLWPDLSEDKAKNNFYVAWSTMKSALMGPDSKEGPCPYVESRRGRCRVVRESLHSDVDAFETLLEKARTAEAENRPADTVSALQELMSVYRGDLLPGDVYDDWFSSLRDRYRFEFIDAMLRGVDLLLEKDDPFEALVFARRGLMVDPYREDLYQAALRCQILAGQRSAAIETFIQCKTQLAEELGLDPAAETLALYQQILAMEERPRYDTYGLTEE